MCISTYGNSARHCGHRLWRGLLLVLVAILLLALPAIARADVITEHYILAEYEPGHGHVFSYQLVASLDKEIGQNVPVEAVSLDKNTMQLEEGNHGQLTATVTPANAGNTSVTWQSDNTGVAKVFPSGVVIAVAPGNANITVTTEDGNKTATCNVTVTAAKPVPVESVTMNKNTLQMAVGNTEQLTATLTPTNIGNKTATWQSSNPGVATVNQNGLVTAVAPGSATITLTVTTGDTSKTATCNVTVTSEPLTPSVPEAKNVSVTGDYSVGSKLTGNYDFYDAGGDTEYGSAYRWLRSDTYDGHYAPISGATGQEYTVTPADAGKYIKFEVTPQTLGGKKASEPETSPPVYIGHDTGDTGDYKLWPNGETHDLYKTWTIKLSLPVNPSTLDGSVYVQDATGRKLNQKLELADDNATIKVYSPDTGYEPNSMYTLIVEKTLFSINDKPLREAIKMDFWVYREE